MKYLSAPMHYLLMWSDEIKSKPFVWIGAQRFISDFKGAVWLKQTKKKRKSILLMLDLINHLFKKKIIIISKKKQYNTKGTQKTALIYCLVY